MTFAERFAKIMELSQALKAQKGRMIALAAKDLQFTAKDIAHEVDITLDRLKMFEETREFLKNRRPLGGPDAHVALMLSYNGSA